MGYGFTCDGDLVDDCEGEYEEELPAFMGSIRERWFMRTPGGGRLADMGHSPEQTITLCGSCLLEILHSP